MSTYFRQPVAHAERHVLWLTNPKTGEHPLLLETILTGTEYTPTAALPPGNYRFWVRAINSVGAAGT